MTDFVLSKHTVDMLTERNIPEAWVRETLERPDWQSGGADGNLHYFKGIPERGGRFLHVIVNADVSPNKVVTVFFDRRARREL